MFIRKKDYKIKIQDNHSSVTVLAPHGGRIEPGTSEIARTLSDNRFNLYLFEGIRGSGNYKLHIPSTKFVEPQCLRLIRQSEIAVAIHGCTDREWADIYVGGLHPLKVHLLYWLLQKGYRATYDMRFGGVSRKNICNRTRTGRGLQLELTKSFRKKMLRNSAQRKEFTNEIRAVLTQGLPINYRNSWLNSSITRS